MGTFSTLSKMKLVALLTMVSAQSILSSQCITDCSSPLSPNTTIDIRITYSNPNSELAPFPYISNLKLRAFDANNETRGKSRDYTWSRNQQNLVVKFRPLEWVNSSRRIGLRATWIENNYDDTMGGYGTVILQYFNIVNATTGSGPIVIGTSSSSNSALIQIGSWVVLFLNIIFL